MIAGRKSHYAAGARILRNRRQLIEGAAKLERARSLQDFRLEKYLSTDAIAENGRRQQGRAHRKWRDHAGGGIDVRGTHKRARDGFIHERLVTRLPRVRQGCLRGGVMQWNAAANHAAARAATHDSGMIWAVARSTANRTRLPAFRA